MNEKTEIKAGKEGVTILYKEASGALIGAGVVILILMAIGIFLIGISVSEWVLLLFGSLSLILIGAGIGLYAFKK